MTSNAEEATVAGTPKEVVKTFLEALWRSDFDGAKSCFAPDAQWFFMPSLGYPQPLTAYQALDHIRDDMFSAFDKNTTLDVRWEHLIAEGDQVAAEYIAYSKTRSGKPYENRYCLRATVKNGRIVHVRPYTDTQALSALMND